mgnify:FL=1
MKKSIVLCIAFMCTNLFFAQQSDENTTQIPTPNYRLASKFSPENLAKLVHSTEVRPHWLKNGNRFWYQYKTTDGSNYYLVDADRRTKAKLFDNEKMARWLTQITKDPYDAKHLPRFNFKFVKNETAIRFRVTSTEKIPAVDDKVCKKDSTTTKKVLRKSPRWNRKCIISNTV